VACVVGTGTALGLDIEVHDAHRDINGIGEMVFHPDQLLWLSSRPETERLATFYDLWCEKEAMHKLLCNAGLNPDLSSDEAKNIVNAARKRRVKAIPGSSGVVVSQHRLSRFQKKILNAMTRDDWILARGPSK
ncbi:MAG: 4'-phosphopantetheinyl transferase superfamily protein, partial [Deltaproteobacteria bacterium]|nr:4'-phosphopantetheinyl transferase superfamily protein [Deltaproteobacteria bacterium]